MLRVLCVIVYVGVWDPVVSGVGCGLWYGWAVDVRDACTYMVPVCMQYIYTSHVNTHTHTHTPMSVYCKCT